MNPPAFSFTKWVGRAYARLTQGLRKAYAALTRRFRLRESLSPPSDYPLRHCLKGREALWPQDLPQGAHALETSTESTK